MKVFLDCGTHFGQGLKQFVENHNIDSTWAIHTFEANPVTFKQFMDEHIPKDLPIIAHNKAVSNKNGTVILTMESIPDIGDVGMGSSIIEANNWNPWDNRSKGYYEKQIEVSCIDFSEFIMNNFDKNDYIVCKLDVEGAEYDILEKMIEDGSIDYIDSLSVEWHCSFFDNIEEMKKREQLIMDKLSQYKELSLTTWN